MTLQDIVQGYEELTIVLERHGVCGVWARDLLGKLQEHLIDMHERPTVRVLPSAEDPKEFPKEAYDVDFSDAG